MTRKIFHLFVFTALFVAAISLSVSAVDSRVARAKANTLRNYGFSSDARVDGQSDNWNKAPAGPAALGSYASDGNSPGYVIGRSWRDDQAHINPGNMIDVATDGRVHFVYAAQVCAGYTNPSFCARWIHYNMFDPTSAPNGVFINGTTGLPVQPTPFLEGGHFPQMVLSETNRVIIAGEALDPTDEATWAPWTKLWWDVASGTDWGIFLNDTLPMTTQTNNTALRYQQPRIDRQEYLGNYVLHVLSLFGPGSIDGGREMYYHRKVSPVSGPTGTWSSLLITDDVWSNHQDIGTSRGTDGRVSIAWVGYYQQDDPPPLWFITSDNAGESWSTQVDITGYVPDEQDFEPWLECNVHIDADGWSHVVWNAHTGTSIDPSKIFHWTNRIAGSIAGGTISTVDWLQNVFANVDCHGSSNMFNHAKAVISECNGRLYVLWQQFGNPDFPDDCAADTMSDGMRGAANSDIYMNISLGLDGTLWDYRRNLTNSHSPGCDGSDENPCDHDAYPSPSRVGSTTPGGYWGGVPEAFKVRDALDNSYPDDGYFIDVQFINDLVADVARYMDDPQRWSNNPIKWFRLPCVPPVIEPRIVVDADNFVHPAYWVPSGQEVAVEIDVVNIGNDVLDVHTISASYVQGAGWLQINTTSLNMAPSTTDVISVTLNPGGAINPTGTDAVAIEGWVIIESNDLNNPRDSFYIHTVVTENVVQIEYATIHTGLGVPLIMSNNGSVGGVGSGGNLQFFIDTIGAIDEDCDSFLVYLYDACPILMYDASTYFWGPYYSVDDPDPAVNFVPVPGGSLAEVGSTPEYEQYSTGDFVTADSAIGMIRTWAAPSDITASYMVEKWQIFSWDGAPHNGVNLGEWVDMDVPSDTGANNFGEVVEADDYVWVTGQTGDAELCLPSDGRFYTTGLLGYYWQSAYDSDPNVNNTGLDGAYVGPALELMDESYDFIADSVWEFMTRNTFDANNVEIDDKRSLLDFGQFDIPADDTLNIWIVHGSILSGTDVNVATLIADAKVWYMANRDGIGTFGCCGAFTGGYPGNTNCDDQGKRNLADITKLIDHVYISKADLCCNENGNVNADDQGKRNLADITKLIDHVYISKDQTPLCL